MDADVVLRGQLLCDRTQQPAWHQQRAHELVGTQLGKLHVCRRHCLCSCGRFRQMLAVRRGGAVGALGTRFKGVEQASPFAAIHDPARRIEHRMTQFVGQGAECQQLAEFVADGCP